jgi:hypothetical protein
MSHHSSSNKSQSSREIRSAPASVLVREDHNPSRKTGGAGAGAGEENIYEGKAPNIANNTSSDDANPHPSSASPAWVSQEYQVPIRDASTSAAASVNTPLTSSQSRKLGTAGTSTNAKTQQQQQQHTAWEHFSTEANSRDTSHRTRSTATSPNPNPISNPPSTTAVPQAAAAAKAKAKVVELSIQDRVAAGALSATLELLKFAGGATLSTTGKLVAPPLYVTRNIILPNLWHACQDYITSSTPVRAKSWFKIISSSVHHFFSVLRGTARGKVFRHRVVRVGGDILDSISSDDARQLLMDSMGVLVKTAEALHTPEVKALLDQWSVLGCRLVDTAASGRNKQLVHDVSAMIYSACELLADPSTTLALAEVTAYLCHALEMEDAAMHQADKDEADQQAARRHERDAYQRATYVDPVLLQDPDVTVEQVILSSLGMSRASATAFRGGGGGGGVDEDDRDGGSVPSNVLVDEAASETWEHSSVRQQIDDTRSQESQDETADDQLPAEEEEMYQKARNSVNLSLLKEQISQRSANIERTEPLPPYSSGKPISTSGTAPPARDKVPRHNTSRALEQDNQEIEEEDFEDIGVVKTVFEDGTTKRAAARPHVRLDSSDSGVDVPTEEAGQQDDIEWPNLVDPLPTKNETSVHHFYRILDQVLEKKRGQAVESYLNDHADGRGIARDGRAKQQTRAAAAVGTSGTNERLPVHDTIKQRLAKIRAEVGSGLSKEEVSKVNQVETIVREHHVLATLALVAIFLITFAWLGFGCYGVYVFFNPSVKSSWQMAKSALGQTSSPSAQEMIVRIVRTVVHVNEDGQIISQGADTSVAEEGIEKITQCVAAAL